MIIGYASEDEHKRTFKKVPSTSRKRCSCGCNQRSTHFGLANGVVLRGGCELSIRRWVKQSKV